MASNKVSKLLDAKTRGADEAHLFLGLSIGQEHKRGRADELHIQSSVGGYSKGAILPGFWRRSARLQASSSSRRCCWAHSVTMRSALGVSRPFVNWRVSMFTSAFRPLYSAWKRMFGVCASTDDGSGDSGFHVSGAGLRVVAVRACGHAEGCSGALNDGSSAVLRPSGSC